MNVKYKVAAIGIIALGTVLALGWTWLSPKSVNVASPYRATAIDAVYATGTVEPTVMIPIAPKITSRMIALELDEGQNAKKGDVLARFEDADLAAVIGQLEAQQDLAQKELSRKQKLYAKKFISSDAYDQAKANFEVIAASIEEAKAKKDYTTLTAPPRFTNY